MQRSMRQLVVVAAAIVTGVVIFVYALDNGDESSGAPQEPTATATETVIPEEPVATPTTAPAVDPADTSVLVANSTGVDGLAGGTSNEIGSRLGFTMLPAVDSTSEPLEATVIYFQPGFDAAAQAIGAMLTLGPAAAIAPMPPDAPVADLGSADVLVVLGTDRAPADG